jgi:hypothetical protein
VPVHRRYVVRGRMPLRRTPQSGLFTTNFKEDAFFIELTERALLFNSGARTEQTLQLPLYYVDEGYYMRQKMVDSIGLVGANKRLELYIQYALLPVLDNDSLDQLRKTALERAALTRQKYVERKERQASLDMLLLEWCDEPVLYFDYERSNTNLRLEVRVPPLPPVPVAARTKRGRQTYYRDFEEMVCAKAAYYCISAFEALPPLQMVELNMYRMEAEPVQGLTIIEEETREKKVPEGLKRIDPATLPPPESARERRAREIEAEKQRKAALALQKKEAKEKKKLLLTTRPSDEFDELFDGTLPYKSTLLSARIPRPDFMHLAKSKTSYSALYALSQFEFRFAPNEDTARLEQVEPFFEIKNAQP